MKQLNIGKVYRNVCNGLKGSRRIGIYNAIAGDHRDLVHDACLALFSRVSIDKINDDEHLKRLIWQAVNWARLSQIRGLKYSNELTKMERTSFQESAEDETKVDFNESTDTDYEYEMSRKEISKSFPILLYCSAGYNKSDLVRAGMFNNKVTAKRAYDKEVVKALNIIDAGKN